MVDLFELKRRHDQAVEFALVYLIGEKRARLDDIVLRKSELPQFRDGVDHPKTRQWGVPPFPSPLDYAMVPVTAIVHCGVVVRRVYVEPDWADA